MKEETNMMEEWEKKGVSADTQLQEELDDVLKEGEIESHGSRAHWRRVCTTNSRELIAFRHLGMIYILRACRGIYI